MLKKMRSVYAIEISVFNRTCLCFGGCLLYFNDTIGYILWYAGSSKHNL